MIKKLYYLLLFVNTTLFSQHKFLNDPKLSEEDLKSEKSAKYPDAAAEVLYRSIHFRVDYDGYLTQDIVSRVKIYNKDNAGDFLDHQISLYDSGRSLREILSNLKAYTYNYENGKTVSTKVERDEKFASKEDKKYSTQNLLFQMLKTVL